MKLIKATTYLQHSTLVLWRGVIFQYVMILLNGGVSIAFSGTEEPAAYENWSQLEGLVRVAMKNWVLQLQKFFKLSYTLTVPASISSFDVQVKLLLCPVMVWCSGKIAVQVKISKLLFWCSGKIGASTFFKYNVGWSDFMHFNLFNSLPQCIEMVLCIHAFNYDSSFLECLLEERKQGIELILFFQEIGCC